jgi:signal transduction histidine kinase
MGAWRLGNGRELSAEASLAPGEATVRTERFITLGFALIRVVALVLAAANLIIMWRHYRWPELAVVAIGVAAAESALVVRSRRGQGPPRHSRVIALDIACTVAVLTAAGLALKSSASPVTDNVLYPYSVASMVIVVFGMRRWPSTTALPLLVAVPYVGLASWRFGFSFGLVANVLTYWAFALTGLALCGTQRHLSRDLDAARAYAIARTRELADATHAREVQRLELAALQAELASKTERARTFRSLHDNVLQTLEFIARDDDADPRQLRSLVTAEAAWLRSLVEGQAEVGAPGAGLAAALASVAQRHLAVGLRVELNVAGIAQARPLTADTAEALAGAVNEALTNVRKHAGTGRAVVRAAPSGEGIVVTVLDHGRGFDAATAATGLGLPASIRARISEVGGAVTITSAPGAGTHVELEVPWRPLPDEERPARPTAAAS